MMGKVIINTIRDVHTCAELMHTSKCLLELSKKSGEGQQHILMGSIIFSAFAFEAYLNHLGKKLFSNSKWDEIEKLGPKDKLIEISKETSLNLDFGKPPFQSITELIRFRNELAHGKTVKLEIRSTESLEKYNNRDVWDFRATTRWEKLCTQDKAEKFCRDVKEIADQLSRAAKIDDEFPFQGGAILTSSSLVSD